MAVPQAAGTAQDLKERVQQTQSKAVANAGGSNQPKTIAQWIDSMKPEIAKALPKHITPDRLARVALTTIRLNTKLQQCNVQSLMAAVMLSAQLGLEPGPLGQCYLVPYGQECQFILGYKGMIDLMWRSGMYKTLYVQDVCEKDHFEYERGDNPRMVHKPPFTDRGKVLGYYLFAEYQNGGKFVHVMTMADIEKHRLRSKSKDSGPWVSDFEAMCKKTVVRDASRWMPMSIELQRQIAQDNAVKVEVEADMTEAPSVIDAEFTDHGAAEAGAAEGQG